MRKRLPNTYDPWDSLIQKTFKQCQPQFQAKVYSLTHSRIGPEDARHKAYKELQPMFRKALPDAHGFLERQNDLV